MHDDGHVPPLNRIELLVVISHRPSDRKSGRVVVIVAVFPVKAFLFCSSEANGAVQVSASHIHFDWVVSASHKNFPLM
jgi:hypothetical protein